MPRSLAVIAFVIAAVTAAAGCANDGRELRAPPPGVTAPPPPTVAPPPTAPSFEDASVVTGPGGFAVSSPVVAPGGPLPTRHTCDGGNVSPPLEWTDPPPGTAELALVVLDATGFVHWLVAGIPPEAGATPAGTTPTGTVTANGIGEFDYFGPCPATEAPEIYAVVLLALDEPAGIVPGAEGAKVLPGLEHAATWRASFAVSASGGSLPG